MVSLKTQFRRLLRVETLESRHMFSVLRIGAWNTANNPNTPASDAEYATVLTAIGNQTIQGNTGPLDLLSVSETDTLSVSRLESVLDGLYTAADYEFVISTLDGGGDATGFLYDTKQIELLDSVELEGVLTHHSIRGQFRPTGTSGEADFMAYSIHLKSGNTSSDASQRNVEAAFLRANADALGDGTNTLFLGDFNWHSSDELAYTTFASAGAASAGDVANALGPWSGSTAFVNLHSHSVTDVDSRFDLHLATDELQDGLGLEYVDGSFLVFGNNGSHGFGQPITAGTGASPAVLNALSATSDHLPVIADYEVLVSTPGVRIAETGGATQIIEGKNFDSYSLVLDTVPTEPVTITVLPDSNANIGAGSASSIQLVFTPENALTAQTILVSAFDDTLDEGNHVSIITHTVSSADVDYDGIPVPSLSATTIDNDAPTILINELDSSQIGADTGEFVELYDGGVGNVSLDGHTLVLFNGSDDASYARYDLDGFSTNADGFFVIGNAAVPNVDKIFGSGVLQNGPDAVGLYLADAADFTNDTPATTAGLIDAVVYGTNDVEDTGLLPLLISGQAQRNEDATGSESTQSLARTPDFGTPRITQSYATAAPTPGAANQPPEAGVSIQQSSGRTDVTEGEGNDSYTVVLDTFPQQDVVVNVQPGSQLDLGAGPGTAISLVFTMANGIAPQTVVVTAVDDSNAEQQHTGLITHTIMSIDTSYANIAVPNVPVTISDNDLRSVVINEVDANTPSVDTMDFIELFDGGVGNTSLDGLVVVLFNGNNDSQYGAFDLDGLSTNDDGFFVIGNAAVANVDLVFRNNFLQNGADAVALYEGNASQFLAPTTDDLLDAFVYDTDDSDDPGLLALLPPSESQRNEDDGVPSDVNALARVPDGGRAFDTAGYLLQTPTPGTRNLPLVTGDYDRDGDVDNDDYTTWRNSFGSTTELQADGNGNGTVDAADFAIWRQAFVATSLATHATVTGVPRAALPISAASIVVAEERREGLQWQTIDQYFAVHNSDHEEEEEEEEEAETHLLTGTDLPHGKLADAAST